MNAVKPDVPGTIRQRPTPKPRTEPKPPKVCPLCHLELLPSGPCAYCD